ncbi:alpha/beta hydrolase [Tamaricihabitans halophyticus]|uniref:alpha/beta hydrolase n=1 Tax=Tamaricihabitans halophyticus TaxID=1262583 RepID=UPI001FB35B39|nr:alpha/beta hydrolase [Tamaricihabitans halophyticus]
MATEHWSWALAGHAGEIRARTWPNPRAHWLAVLVHGYGEHIGRYQHVADALIEAGAVVIGNDHVGHGESAGERVLFRDFESVVDDLHEVIVQTDAEHRNLPIVLIGHSLGGMIATRYAQRHRDELTALVLSGPVLGSWKALDLLKYEEIPEDPIDVSTLSRDPGVGSAYAADPLVWHGPFRRRTLWAIEKCLGTIDAHGPFGDDLPALWLHGGEDELVPIAETRTGIDRVRGLGFEEIEYPGARHEIFNETNSKQVLGDVVSFVHRVLG